MSWRFGVFSMKIDLVWKLFRAAYSFQRVLRGISDSYRAQTASKIEEPPSPFLPLDEKQERGKSDIVACWAIEKDGVCNYIYYVPRDENGRINRSNRWGIVDCLVFN